MSIDAEIPAAAVADVSVKTKKSKKEKKTQVEGGDDSSKKEKKEKKDKKRKREEEATESAEAVAESVEVADGEKKKKKKSKQEGAGTESTVSTPVTDGEAKLSKKEKKKLAKATAAGSDSTAEATTPVAAKEASSTYDLSAPSASDSETAAYLAENGITVTPATAEYNPYLSFSSLPINTKLRPFLAAYQKPTPIQSCSWPPLFRGKDVVGIAETGSGKTLAFGLPGVHMLSTTEPVNPKASIRLLVIAPTRELASQTFEQLEKLGKFVGIGAVCLFGGVSRDEQARAVKQKNVKIVVGTPGRIMDLAESKEVDFSGVQYLVLDEADRMLDQGFENDIRRIIGYCPGKDKGRQTVMFSATWPESVRRLAGTFLSSPVKITVGSDELSANKRIEQKVEVMESPREKDPRLIYHLRNFMKSHPKNSPFPARILVFALYKKEATRLEQTISRAGFTVAGLHGDLGQEARFKALNAFKEGNVNVLVATDVAARGLDIPDVGLVINVTFPLTTGESTIAFSPLHQYPTFDNHTNISPLSFFHPSILSFPLILPSPPPQRTLSTDVDEQVEPERQVKPSPSSPVKTTNDLSPANSVECYVMPVRRYPQRWIDSPPPSRRRSMVLTVLSTEILPMRRLLRRSSSIRCNEATIHVTF